MLAVTRLSDGVCVAGITRGGKWIRPIRPNSGDTWRQVEKADCKDKDGKWVVCKGCVVDMDIRDPIPRDIHVED